MKFGLIFLFLFNILFTALPVSRSVGSALETDDLCPLNWAQFERKCYYFGRKRSTFEESMSFCSQRNSTLASVHSWEDHKFLTELQESLDMTVYRMTDTFWLGALPVPHAFNEYKWLDATRFNYKNWSLDANHNCPLFYPCRIAMKSWGFGSQWKLYKAGEETYPICQIEMQTQREEEAEAQFEETEKSTEPEDDCPWEWYSFRNKCFLINTSEATFKENEELCHTLNATMVTIHSLEESLFLENLIYEVYGLQSSSRIWLGAEATFTRKQPYEWVDKSPFNFSQWAKNEPNCRQHCCGVTFKGIYQWKDSDCSNEWIQSCQSLIKRTQSPEIDATVDSDLGGYNASEEEEGACLMSTGWSHPRLGSFESLPNYCDIDCYRPCCFPQDVEDIDIKFILSTATRKDYLIRWSQKSSAKKLSSGLVYILVNGLSAEKRVNNTKRLLLSEDVNCNVIVIEWSHGNSLSHGQSLANLRVVGAVIGFFTSSLELTERTVLIGSKLGVQVIRESGEWLRSKGKGSKLKECQAVDGKGPGFDDCGNLVNTHHCKVINVK